MVIETFGYMLYYPNSETHAEFPSPESLKNKVILSTKPPKEYLEAISFKKEDECRRRSISNEEDEWGEIPDLNAQIESYKVWFHID